MPTATTPPLGAIPLEPGLAELRVWAPHVRSVAARLDAGDHPLAEEGDGVWAGTVPAAPGDDYRFVLDRGDAWPDPCSRCQPEGVHGPSRIVDTSAFRIEPGPGLALEELVLYELHVGTFSPEGTFDGVVPRLAGLRELGVTAIELMPVATFPGERGWGYDGLHTSAVHAAYGGPQGLARLVDAAHREGLGVVLDVVYNHLGPGSEALTAFGPTSGRASRRRGAGRSTSRRPACASGRSRTRSSGCATTGSTASASTPSTPCTTTRASTCSPSSPTVSASSTRGRS